MWTHLAWIKWVYGLEDAMWLTLNSLLDISIFFRVNTQIFPKITAYTKPFYVYYAYNWPTAKPTNRNKSDQNLSNHTKVYKTLRTLHAIAHLINFHEFYMGLIKWSTLHTQNLHHIFINISAFIPIYPQMQ